MGGSRVSSVRVSRTPSPQGETCAHFPPPLTRVLGGPEFRVPGPRSPGRRASPLQALGPSRAGPRQLSPAPDRPTRPPHLESPGTCRRHNLVARQQSGGRRLRREPEAEVRSLKRPPLPRCLATRRCTVRSSGRLRGSRLGRGALAAGVRAEWGSRPRGGRVRGQGPGPSSLVEAPFAVGRHRQWWGPWRGPVTSGRAR